MGARRKLKADHMDMVRDQDSTTPVDGTIVQHTVLLAEDVGSQIK